MSNGNIKGNVVCTEYDYDDKCIDCEHYPACSVFIQSHIDDGIITDARVIRMVK